MSRNGRVHGGSALRAFATRLMLLRHDQLDLQVERVGLFAGRRLDNDEQLGRCELLATSCH